MVLRKLQSAALNPRLMTPRDVVHCNAPECLSKQEVPTELSDIYCFGMLIMNAVSLIDNFTDSLFNIAGWSQNDRRD
uniref:Protein kinase domain-containing protein n=1 Tax=Globisporangium ultimum (strain ATCC 200006 / CBS 805.95 / DAOM BR144) TaxID=431595 RepID=K3WGZ1_GLOUD